MQSDAHPFSVRAYRGLSRFLSLYARRHLQKRMGLGKEHPTRWVEKLGHAGLARPKGRLIWLHAVGLGEVLALRGLIDILHNRDPKLHFLVTSGTLASADVFSQNAPPNTQHQFLPLDCPRYIERFLDHWTPDLSLWSEQEIWPNHVVAARNRAIPLALINGRLTEKAFLSRMRMRSLYAYVYGCFDLVAAQNADTADHLRNLGAANVITHPTLKASCAALSADPDVLIQMQSATQGRMVWVLASSHTADEDVALAAHRKVLDQNPNALLIIAPRYPSVADALHRHCQQKGFTTTRRSQTDLPDINTQVYIADSFGELGLWYRLADHALIGGSFGDTGGHNPWEAAQLNCAILHGPNMANFIPDMQDLHAHQAALAVTTADEVAQALQDDATRDMAVRARGVADQAQQGLTQLSDDVLKLLKP
ncbi:3-deoxy-D-manno-octulosonic acid transferase [Cochlodiniinecator piscidefendens]|uniref:3-deoxy-D-manno-octulosonic acid transferase n=1 Tax=Cochlodiniinecator piscidefendens TaxID=2715756 RepID=UPI00140C608E|nr:glycosyltransferase N-terminal domain-containing protein [Cochlodiniinecator piscidefendens]